MVTREFRNLRLILKRDSAPPGRGWYTLFPFILTERYNFERLRWSLDDRDSLVLARICLEPYSERPLDEKGLSQIRDILEFFKKYKKDVILRFVYDDEGKGLLYEPDNIELIKEHMRQIGKVIVPYADNILTLQGIFVGSWGEMHTSRYLSDENIKSLILTLYYATEGKLRLAVRKPSQRQMLESLNMPELIKLIGFYNDAMTASATDYGTFDDNPIKRELQRRYVSECCGKVDGMGILCGGEAVNPNDLNDFESAEKYLRRLKVTYLNRQYDDNVLAKWKQLGMFDRIGEKLGYRIELKKVKPGLFGKRREEGVVDFILENVGYAPFYEPFDMVALTRDGKDKIYANQVKPGLPALETCTFTFKMKDLPPHGEIFLERVRDGRIIHIY